MQKTLKHLIFTSSLAVCMGFQASPSHAQTTTTNIAVTCQNQQGQVCEPGYSVPFVTQNDWKIVSMKLTMPSTHCAAMRAHVFLDGKLVHTTGYLGHTSPLSTSLIPLQAVRPGTHLLEIKAEGKTGGCNTGGMNGGSWSGTLKLTH